jgi:hypothetical protein
MANPNYAVLLAQIAAETDPVAKAALIAQCYVFEDTPTLEEQELFEYCAFDYVENNPGYVEGYSGSETSYLYVLPDYVAAGYINIENADVGLYVDAGYVEDGYVASSSGVEASGFIAYVGEYYNNNGERT